MLHCYYYYVRGLLFAADWLLWLSRPDSDRWCDFYLQCQLGHIKDLFSLLSDDGLKANLQSYAALWECMGRQKTLDIAAGQKVLDAMETEVGVSLGSPGRLTWPALFVYARVKVALYFRWHLYCGSAKHWTPEALSFCKTWIARFKKNCRTKSGCIKAVSFKIKVELTCLGITKSESVL